MVRHLNFTNFSRRCFAIAAIASLAGCSSDVRPFFEVTPVKEETVISRTSALSNVYVLDKDTNFVTCTEPPPDSAYQQLEDMDLSFSLVKVGGNDKAGGAEGSEEAPLVGRTPGVLIARELFFRACEFSRNYDLTKAEALALYRDTLNAVGEGWKVEGANTTVKIDESEINNVTQVIPGVVDGSHSGGDTATGATGQTGNNSTVRSTFSRGSSSSLRRTNTPSSRSRSSIWSR